MAMFYSWEQMTLISHTFNAYKTGQLNSSSSQARKTMLPPFSNNSTGYLLSKESTSKFCSTFSSVLLTLHQSIYHLLWNSMYQCVGDCDQLQIQPGWRYQKYTPGHLNLLLIKHSASMHHGFGIVCLFQCALLSPFLRLKKGWKLTCLLKFNYFCCIFVQTFVYAHVIVALCAVIILKWRLTNAFCMYVRQTKNRSILLQNK